MAQDRKCFIPSQDILLHVLLNPLVQEAFHTHIQDGIRHILIEVDLLQLQAASQEVSTTQGSSVISSIEMKRRCLLTALVIETTHLV